MLLAIALIVGTDPAQGAPSFQFGKSKWVIPPIRVKGEIYELLRVDDGTRQARSVSATTAVSVNASSYIWRPWFAQVDGEVAANHSRTVVVQSSPSNNIFFTGSGALDLLPLSRFPFNAHYSQGDGRNDTNLVSISTRTRKYGMVQRYTVPSSMQRYSLGYDRSVIKSAGRGDAFTSLFGSMGARINDTQDMDMHGSVTRKIKDGSPDTSEQRTITLNHRYSEPEVLVLKVNTLANAGKFTYQGLQSGSLASYVQFNSFANWLPDTEKPLKVTGSARASEFRNEQTQGKAVAKTKKREMAVTGSATYAYSEKTTLTGNAGFSRFQNVGGNSYSANQGLSISHRLSTSVSVTGGMTMTENHTNNSQSLASSQNAGISYSPFPPRVIKGFTHTWSTSASISNSVSNHRPPSQRASIQARQRLTRTIPFSKTSTLDLGFNQTGALRTRAQQISHEATMVLGRKLESSTAYVRMSLIDSRTYGEQKSGHESANFQATLDATPTHNTSLGGSLTLQASRKLFDPKPSGLDTMAMGELRYSNQRFMNVLRLALTSTLRANWYRTGAVDQLGSGGAVDNKSLVWENQLGYRVGLLSANLTMRVGKVDNVLTQSWILYLNRRF